MGGVVGRPAACLAFATQLRLPREREATFERLASEPIRFGGAARESSLGGALAGTHDFGCESPIGQLHRYRRGFGQGQRDEDCAAPQLRPGSGEALCDAFAGALPLVAACCDAQRLRSPHDTPQTQLFGPSGVNAVFELARVRPRIQ